MSVSWERSFDFTIEKSDNKKCKSQSFEYGENEKESKENLLSELDRFIEMLIKFRSDID